MHQRYVTIGLTSSESISAEGLSRADSHKIVPFGCRKQALLTRIRSSWTGIERIEAAAQRATLIGAGSVVAKPWLCWWYPSCCLSADGPSPSGCISRRSRSNQSSPPSNPFSQATIVRSSHNPPGKAVRTTQASQAATSEMCSAR